LLLFLDIGGAYGTAKSGVALGSLGIQREGDVMRNLIPVIMAGVLGIYGLIVAITIHQRSKQFCWLLICVIDSFSPYFTANIISNYLLYSFIFLFKQILCVVDADSYSSYASFAHFGSGLCVGVSSLGSGYAIGIVGDVMVRANGQRPKLYVPMVIMLCWASALGLYGLILGVLLAAKG
jgi:V-type H+-transporting ATPase proteolipid subunit